MSPTNPTHRSYQPGHRHVPCSTCCANRPHLAPYCSISLDCIYRRSFILCPCSIACSHGFWQSTKALPRRIQSSHCLRHADSILFLSSPRQNQCTRSSGIVQSGISLRGGLSTIAFPKFRPLRFQLHPSFPTLELKLVNTLFPNLAQSLCKATQPCAAIIPSLRTHPPYLCTCRWLLLLLLLPPPLLLLHPNITRSPLSRTTHLESVSLGHQPTVPTPFCLLS